MKKSVALVAVVLVSVFFISFVSAGWFSDGWNFITGNVVNSNVTCTDSDGGIDYYKKGYSYGSLYLADEDIISPMNYSDWCSYSNGYEYAEDFYCTPEGYLRQTATFPCPNGCVDGACVNTTTPTCTDSDGGLNYYVRGIASQEGIGEDKCKVQCSSTLSGLCDSNLSLLEYYCNNGRADSSFYTCPNGCVDGACVKVTTQINCGNGACVYPENATNCPSDCTAMSPCTSFTYSAWSNCTNGQQTRTITGSTPSSCTGGNPVLSQACIVTPPTSSCTDSDGGLDYYIKGEITNGGVYLDSDLCNSDGSLSEKYCISTTVYGAKPFNCPNGCMDGACVRYEENNLTVDNKGTKINSFGEHTILNGDFLWFDNVHRRIEIIASEQSLYFYNLEEYGAIGNSYADLSVGKSTVITRDDSPMAKSLFSEVGIDLVEINNRGAVIKIFNSSLSEEYKLRCVELGDRGRNLEMKGKVFGYDFASNEPIVLEDHCDEEGYLWEYSCKENFTQGNRDNINAERVPCVYGCVDGTCEGARQCSSLGFRENSKFCSSANYFMPQKDKDEFCENNFECLSNSCLDSKCVEVGLWTKILNWFRNLFG